MEFVQLLPTKLLFYYPLNGGRSISTSENVSLFEDRVHLWLRVVVNSKSFSLQTKCATSMLPVISIALLKLFKVLEVQQMPKKLFLENILCLYAYILIERTSCSGKSASSSAYWKEPFCRLPTHSVAKGPPSWSMTHTLIFHSWKTACLGHLLSEPSQSNLETMVHLKKHSPDGSAGFPYNYVCLVSVHLWTLGWRAPNHN